jgi:hypothetical protein
VIPAPAAAIGAPASGSQGRRLTVVPDGPPEATELADTLVLPEAEMLRARALRLLAIGVGDHTPAEVREQVAAA